MEDETIDTQVEAETTTTETTEQKPISEILDEPKTVGLDKFLAIKKENKAFEQRIKELEDSINSATTYEDVADDVEDIGNEYNVDPKFLSKLTNSIKKELEGKLDAKLEPITKREKEASIEKIFSKHYDKAMESMVDYEDVVNRDVIKQLTLLPSNKDKTIPQLIEETYGRTITGKRSIETTTPGGGKEPEPLDYARAKKDTEYFAQIMADPKKKAAYNERMITEGF